MPQTKIEAKIKWNSQERMQKFREIGNLKPLFRNELNKLSFAHDATYSDSEDLAKKTFFDKILIDKAFETAKNSKNNGYQRALASMLYKFFDDKTGSRVRVNGQLFEELHKPVN